MFSMSVRYIAVAVSLSVLVSACGGGGSPSTGNNNDTTNTSNSNSTSAPAAPGPLSITATSPDRVTLTWVDNSLNESGFALERKTGVGGSYVLLANIAANSTIYFDDTVVLNEQYYYRVSAYNTQGSSATSNEVSTVISGTPPAAPVSLTATAVSPTQINLSWSDTSDNELNFYVERKVGPNGTFSLFATLNANETSFSDTPLDEQRLYTYRVRAYNLWGASAYTNEANTVTQSVSAAGRWARTYAGPGEAYAYSVVNTSDGGFLIAGKLNISRSGPTNNDAWLIKLASDETIEWQKTYGGGSNDVANSVIQTADGGYVLAGATSSFPMPSASNDIWVIKLNSLGVVQWQQRYGTGPDESAKAIVQTDDNADGNRDDGYILVGTNSSLNGAQIIKLDNTGAIEWQQQHETGFGSVTAYSVQQTADGGYVITGEVYNTTSSKRDLWVMKLTSAGAVTWDKVYAGADNSSGRKIIQSDDNSDGVADDGYMVVGVTDTDATSTILDALWAIKLNSDGSIAWQKTLSGNGTESANDVTQTASGAFLIAATSTAFGASSNDFWLVQLLSDGSVDWEKRYGGSGGETPYAIRQTPDLGLIAVGNTSSFAPGSNEMWALRLDSTTNISFISGLNASSQTTSASVSDTVTSGVDRNRNPSLTSLPANLTAATVADSDALVETQSQN